jgi:hypothetical protein
MWPRVVELMLACWLGVSPFTFRHNPQQRELWLNDLACALAIVTLSLLSFWRPCRAAHFGLCGVAIWLIRFGYAMAPIPALPALQNDILVGMLLLMFAIIPNEANVPPRSWSDLGS